VLIIDDAGPDPRVGSGFPRAAALTQALFELNYLVTLYTTNGRPDGRSPLNPQLEIIPGNPAGLRDFLLSRPHYDLVIVSRPHNMQYVKAAVGSDLSGLGAPCIYDAEALYALREIRRRTLTGQPMTDADQQTLIDAELSLARGCAAVLAVSEGERQLFAGAAVTAARNFTSNPNRAQVHVVGHAIEPRPTPNAFEARRSILFVGAFSAQSSNEDAVLQLCGEVMPALRTTWNCDPPVVVAGADIPDRLKALDAPGIAWHADVDDLTPLYDNARVFVAPTRYSAGISLKVIEAAARGVPVVCTRLVADQLGWESGVELVAADGADELAGAIASLYQDAALWARVRAAALRRVANDYSAIRFRSALQNSLRTSPEGEAGSGRSQRPSLRTVATGGD
jgi:hypothetical protein